MLFFIFVAIQKSEEVMDSDYEMSLFLKAIPEHFLPINTQPDIAFRKAEDVDIKYFSWLKYHYAPAILRDEKDLETDTIIYGSKTNLLEPDRTQPSNKFIVIDSFSFEDVHFYLQVKTKHD